jgi:hypothetical protein
MEFYTLQGSNDQYISQILGIRGDLKIFDWKVFRYNFMPIDDACAKSDPGDRGEFGIQNASKSCRLL